MSKHKRFKPERPPCTTWFGQPKIQFATDADCLAAIAELKANRPAQSSRKPSDHRLQSYQCGSHYHIGHKAAPPIEYSPYWETLEIELGKRALTHLVKGDSDGFFHQRFAAAENRRLFGNTYLNPKAHWKEGRSRRGLA